MRLFPTQTQGQEFRTLDDLGYFGSLVDKQRAYLLAQGYSPFLADAISKFIKDGFPTVLPPNVAPTGDNKTLPFLVPAGAGADVTAPVLSSPIDAANGQTAMTGSVTTDEGNGTLYWVVSTSATAPTNTQVEAGQMHTGAAAAASGSQAVSTTGVQNIIDSGLTANTTYYTHYMHKDTAGNKSAVSSADGFTTTAAGSGITGHDTPITVYNSTATNTYSGNITSVSASDMLIIVVQAWSGNGSEDPAGWTVTLGGNAITPSSTSFSTSIDYSTAIYEVASHGTGDLALAVTLNVAGRASAAYAWKIQGHNVTTPVAARNASTKYTADDTTVAYTRTTAADGNVLLSIFGVRNGLISGEMGGSGGVTLGTAATTGATSTNDISHVTGYDVVDVAGSVTHTYTTTTAARMVAAFIEINKG